MTRISQSTGIIDNLEPFNPEMDNWNAYTERLEQLYCQQHTWWQESSYFINNNWQKGLQPFTEFARSHLDPQPVVIAQCFKFHQQCQKWDESILQFIALCKYAEHCHFQDKLDEPIHDMFVCVLRNETMQKWLLAEKNLTLATLIEIAQRMEAANK